MASIIGPTVVAEPRLSFGEFYDAIFASTDVAAYVIRVGDDGEFTFEDANGVIERISGMPLAEIRGKPPAHSLSEEIAECLTSHLRQCVATAKPLLYQRTLEAPGGKVSFNTALTPICRPPDGVKFVIGMTRDVTDETAALENARHHAELLRSLGIAFPEAMYMLDLESKTLKFISGERSAEQLAWRNGAEGVGPEAAAKFFHPDDRPLMDAHWADLAALKDGEVSTTSYRLLATKGEFRRHVNRETVFSRDGDGKVRLVLGVSADVSEHDRMEQEVRDLSARMLTLQMEERRRIAQELHDSTGQHLTAASLALGNAQAMPRSAKDDEFLDNLMAVVDDAAACVGEAHREIRVLSYLLHPPQLLSQGLPEALGSFARGFGMRARIRIDVEVDPAARTIDDETAVQLFRICQEALTNVYRHASARKAHVILDVDDAAIRLTVKDDGVGIDDAAMDGILGVGLSGIRQRISRLGGEFAISGDPGGTALIASLPYRPHADSGGNPGRLGGDLATIRNFWAT